MNTLTTSAAKDLYIRYSYNKKVRKMTMKIETTKMSSRGQIVIPQDVRNEIKADEGTVFLVMTSGDTLILKKVKTPSTEEILKNLEEMAKDGREHLEKMGIKESDIPDIIHRHRARKRSQ